MSILKHKLVIKHRNPLKVRKQKLIDRINSCKNLSELKGFEKTLKYHSILKNDEDWDYGFLFNLIEFKLKRMSQHFHTHDIVVNEDWYGTLCDRAVAILNAGYLNDIVLEKELNGIYVNTRNVHKFFNQKELDVILKQGLKAYYLPTVREAKAKALFWKFLHHYVELLWD